MRAPMLAPAVSLAAGVGLARWAGLTLTESSAALVAFAILAILAHRLGLKTRRVAMPLAWLAAGGVLWSLRQPGAPPELDFQPGTLVRIEGCVVDPPQFYPDYARFELELAQDARVRVTASLPAEPPLPPLPYGTRIAVQARLHHPRTYHNPGSFDFTDWLAHQDVYWKASMARRTEPEVLPGSCGNVFTKAIFGLRGWILTSLDELYPGDGPERGLMRALVIGDATALRQVWIDEFRRTGTYHALVISGTQVGVLAVTLLILTRAAGFPLGLGLSLTAICAWIYALAAGFDPPVARAAVGCSLFAIGRYWHRRGQGLNLLAAVVILFLVADPHQLFDASFQLSFLCVAALAGLAAPFVEGVITPWSEAARGLTDSRRDVQIRDPRVLSLRVELRLVAELLALATRLRIAIAQSAVAVCIRVLCTVLGLVLTSLTVQLALALPMMFYFHRLSLTGLSANLFVIPLTSWAIPLGFVALLTKFAPFVYAAGWCARTSADIVTWHARWEGSTRVPDPPMLFLVLCVLAWCACSWALFRRRRAAAPLAAVALACLVLIAALPATADSPGGLEFTLIDVGQGDSLFLRFPDKTTLLVDTGGMPVFGKTPPARRFDVGEEVVSPYLWQRRLRKLDYVAITHLHEDHVGGLKAVCANFRPKEVWTGRLPEGTSLDSQVPYRPLHRGDRFRFGQATVEVLWPARDAPPVSKPNNNDSLVLLVRYGRTAFLLTGDAEHYVESDLLANDLVPRVDVLKVGHHGSRNASSPAFLDAAQPAWAFLSVGAENSYHLPNEQTLDRLAARHVQVRRTDRDGAVTIASDGRYVMIER